MVTDVLDNILESVGMQNSDVDLGFEVNWLGAGAEGCVEHPQTFWQSAHGEVTTGAWNKKTSNLNPPFWWKSKLDVAKSALFDEN